MLAPCFYYFHKEVSLLWERLWLWRGEKMERKNRSVGLQRLKSKGEMKEKLLIDGDFS